MNAETIIILLVINFLTYSGVMLIQHFKKKVINKEKEHTVESFISTITNGKTGLIALTEEHLSSIEVDQEELKKVEIFPFSLTPYMQKLNVIEVGQEMIKVLSSKKDNDDIRDIYRAITIASALFKFEIPLILLALDQRTVALYHSFLYIQTLREIPKMITPSPEKEKELEEFLAHTGNWKQYQLLFPVVAKSLLHCCSNGHYVGFPCYSSTFNRMNDSMFSRDFSHEEIRSITTAFGASTFTKIPLSYISLDNLAFALIQEANPELHKSKVAQVVSIDAFRKKEG